MATTPEDTDIRSKYDIDTFSYPYDLDDAKYGGHRVVFMINVRGGGKIVQKETHNMIAIPPNPSVKQFAGERIADSLKSFVPNTKSYDFAKTDKRLTSAISLYIPEALGKNYSVDWDVASSESMMMGEALSQAVLKGGEAVSNSKGNDIDAIIAGATGVGKIGASVAGAMKLNGSTYAQKSLGMTPGNSKAQLLFNQVNFGEFTFDYKFAPRDEAECQVVMNIIRMFRHHMLPEFFDEAQFLYIYPSEFEVAYYFGDSENEFMEKHITAALTSMNINYNPNGQFMTFANGMPTHINVTLQFKELGTPSKETSPEDKSGA